ncbi:MAG: ROK family protein [Actinobacteria bacterium]|nr:ROK family protein [Actinomycetota bacterium]MBW3650848.1 ROK family protein [Actinomycetota bacterium]
MPASPLTVGVDLGGTKCLGVVADADGAVVDELRVATPPGAPAIAATVADMAATLVERTPGIAAVGIGAPGLVDRDGTLRSAPNLPGVVDLCLVDPLALQLGLPVVVENDATCAGWGERQVGAGRGRDDVVFVTLGTGIGGGMVLGGRLYRGANGYAGEIGHMVVDPRGPACPCGRRGCWERFASGSGLGRLAREAARAGRAARTVELAGGEPEAVRGEHVTAAAAEGDPEAVEVLADFGWWVALGLSNLANALDPQAFVLGGGLVEAGEVLFAPVRASFSELLHSSGAAGRPPVEVLPAALGEHAGAIGAALLAQQPPP